MITTKLLHRNIESIMRIIYVFFCILILLTASYFYLTKDADPVSHDDSRRDQNNNKVFTVSETYLRESELDGRLICLEGQLSTAGGMLYLVDIVGDRKIQVTDRVFELKDGSLSNLVILKGTYEVSDDLLIDNLLKNLECIRPTTKPLETK